MTEPKVTSKRCPSCREFFGLTQKEAEDFEFFGECLGCRMKPLTGQTHGESPAASHDREYHGGMFSGGEW